MPDGKEVGNIDIKEKTSREKAVNVTNLIGSIAVVIEQKDCTYGEVMCALDAIRKNYEKKGCDLLESTSIQKIAEFGGLLDREPDRFGAKTTIEIYDHYGRQQDYEKVKAGEYSRVDFLEGKEEDIRELTADMAGFGCNQSQRVIIEYDKGYGYFLVKRIPVEYGEPGSDQQDKRDTTCQKGINRTIHGTGIRMNSADDDISLDCRLSFHCAKSRDKVSLAVKEFFSKIAEILEEDRKQFGDMSRGK